MNRDLDGVYFRIERDGKWCNICFSDLTPDERNHVLDGKSNDYLKKLCCILGDTIKHIGDTFNITGGMDDE